MRYACWVRMLPGMALGCLFFVQDFVWHSLFPVFTSVIPLYRLIVTGGDRNSLLVLLLPLVVVFELFRDPLSLRYV